MQQPLLPGCQVVGAEGWKPCSPCPAHRGGARHAQDRFCELQSQRAHVAGFMPDSPRCTFVPIPCLGSQFAEPPARNTSREHSLPLVQRLRRPIATARTAAAEGGRSAQAHGSAASRLAFQRRGARCADAAATRERCCSTNCCRHVACMGDGGPVGYGCRLACTGPRPRPVSRVSQP